MLFKTLLDWLSDSGLVANKMPIEYDALLNIRFCISNCDFSIMGPNTGRDATLLLLNSIYCTFMHI